MNPNLDSFTFWVCDLGKIYLPIYTTSVSFLKLEWAYALCLAQLLLHAHADNELGLKEMSKGQGHAVSAEHWFMTTNM